MSAVVRLWFLLALLSVPVHLQAQQEQAIPRRTFLSAGTFVGLGSGPSPSAVWGLEGTIPLSRFFAIRAEYSRWQSGIGVACVDSWPESYACSVSGRARLGGVRATIPVNEAITPFVDLSAGRFSRDRVAADSHSATTVSAGVGATVRIFRGLSAFLGGNFFRPFDDDYEAMMGEELQYMMGRMGLEYRVTR